MQNRYAADVGDFGKFGLLRALMDAVAEDAEPNGSESIEPTGPDLSDAAPPRPHLSLAVLWYLVSASEANTHGGYTAYLQPHQEKTFRPCDVALYDALKLLVQRGKRSVSAIQAVQVLPEITTFHAVELDYGDIPKWDHERRLERRAKWFAKAAAGVVAHDVAFLDPDVGIAPSSLGRSGEKARKYVLLPELRDLAERGLTLVVYQQLGDRRRKSEVQVERWARAVLDAVPGRRTVWSITYTRGTRRAFIIVPADRHAGALWPRLVRFASGPWSRHFESLIRFERTNEGDGLVRAIADVITAA